MDLTSKLYGLLMKLFELYLEWVTSIWFIYFRIVAVSVLFLLYLHLFVHSSSQWIMSYVVSIQSLDLCVAYHCIVLWHHSTWYYTEAASLCSSSVSTPKRVPRITNK